MISHAGLIMVCDEADMQERMELRGGGRRGLIGDCLLDVNRVAPRSPSAIPYHREPTTASVNEHLTPPPSCASPLPRAHPRTIHETGRGDSNASGTPGAAACAGGAYEVRTQRSGARDDKDKRSAWRCSVKPLLFFENVIQYKF